MRLTHIRWILFLYILTARSVFSTNFGDIDRATDITTLWISPSQETTNLTGYVPTSRTITINSTTLDLTANRSWTVSGAVAWGGITGTLSSQTDLQSALDAKVSSNGAISGATNTKITYDTKGLITSGASATTADISDSTDRRYVTDAQQVILGNTSGTNTGDQTTVSGNAGTATKLQNARTIWGQSFDGTGNVTGALSAVTTITGGANNMTITAGTGNSRTLALQSTTSGGVATTFLTGNADQSATFANTVNATTFVGALTGTASGNIASGGALGTPSSGTLTNCTGLPVAGITASTSTALGVGSIELGHATDTTISRSAAGIIAVEGFPIAGSWEGVAKVTGSNYTNGTTGLTDITGLTTGTLTTSTLYEFTANLQVNSSSTAGVQLAVTQTGSGTGGRTTWEGSATNAAATGMAIGSNASGTSGAACVLVNGDGQITISGHVNTSSAGTAGFKLQMLKTTSGTATVYIGSTLKWRRP